MYLNPDQHEQSVSDLPGSAEIPPHDLLEALRVQPFPQRR
jgi:hypothetical protein